MLKLSIILKTTDFRGDHAADVAIAYEAEEHETVQQLATRLLYDEGYIRNGTKVIEIRVVQ